MKILLYSSIDLKKNFSLKDKFRKHNENIKKKNFLDINRVYLQQ